MPGSTVDLLIRVLEQNQGKISKRTTKKSEFKSLTAPEQAFLEALYAEIFLTSHST